MTKPIGRPGSDKQRGRTIAPSANRAFTSGSLSNSSTVRGSGTGMSSSQAATASKPSRSASAAVSPPAAAPGTSGNRRAIRLCGRRLVARIASLA